MYWIDGFGGQILIRSKRITDCLNCLNNPEDNSALQLKTIFSSQVSVYNLVSPNNDSRSKAVI